MDIDFIDERYFCNKIEDEVILSSISNLESGSNSKYQKLLSNAIDCDKKNICGVVESSNGDKSINWRKFVHPELNRYDKLRN